MNPGTTMPPLASMIRVWRDVRARISDVEPTATMRSPLKATASARGWLGSPVHTTPLITAIVGAWLCDIIAGGHPKKASGNARAMWLNTLNGLRMVREAGGRDVSQENVAWPEPNLLAEYSRRASAAGSAKLKMSAGSRGCQSSGPNLASHVLRLPRFGFLWPDIFHS